MTDLAQMLRDRAAAQGGDKLLEEAAAEIEALRAEVARLRRSLHEAVVHGNRQSGRAERLAEALREAADMLLADYPETAKRLRAALHPTAAQEGK